MVKRPILTWRELLLLQADSEGVVVVTSEHGMCACVYVGVVRPG